MDKAMQRALEQDGEKLRQLTGEDHGPHWPLDDQEAAERVVREWDKHDGDRIVRDITEEYFAMLEEFRKLAKAEERK